MVNALRIALVIATAIVVGGWAVRGGHLPAVSGNWILQTNFWNDSGVWDDTAAWQD